MSTPKRKKIPAYAGVERKRNKIPVINGLAYLSVVSQSPAVFSPISSPPLGRVRGTTPGCRDQASQSHKTATSSEGWVPASIRDSGSVMIAAATAKTLSLLNFQLACHQKDVGFILSCLNFLF